MSLTMKQVPKPNRRRQGVVRQFRLNRRKLALLLLVFALATTADTCTDPNTGQPVPHEHTPGPTPNPTPQTDGPGPPPTCPPGQIPWGVFNEWLGCMDDPNAPSPESPQDDEEGGSVPLPDDREESDDGDGTTSKPSPGTYTVKPGTTEDGKEVLVERPPLCNSVTGNDPCIVSYHQDEDGNEVWVLPPREGGNTEDNVDTVYCGSLGDSVDHSSAPIPHTHPAPFPYDHDGNPNTPDICSHNSENCAWHGTCPGPQLPKAPVVNPPPSDLLSKVCTSSWSNSDRQSLVSSLRWESIVPYDQGFASHHHPEVPGGHLFLTAASTPKSPARHWIALKSGRSLDVVDAPKDGCLWTATAVGVSLRELLPHQASDLVKLRSPGRAAAASEARAAAALWDGLSRQRQQWYAAAFPRNDPPTTWCSPGDLPVWTTPTTGVLTLSENWKSSHGKCRWSIPRQGFWEWRLLIDYTSEQGDLHTETVASDLSWFRDPAGYLGQQVTLW